MDCVFCKMVAGEIKPTIVYEDDATFAFLDIDPGAVGHTLVIPKKHYRTFSDIPEDDLQKFIVSVQKVAKAVKAALGSGGYNLVMNTEAAADQVVFHAHMHIMPRNDGDTIKFVRPHPKVTPEERDTLGEKIRKKF